MPSPRAAYIHVPFCRHRCGYCNFTLVAGRDDLIESFLVAIERELSWLGEPIEIDTLFFGGGTPTHLNPEQLTKLLAIVHRSFVLSAGYEFSIEANPADVDSDKLKLLADEGVTRISLGAQSFNTEKLAALERDHRARDIEFAFELSRRHMRSVSLDLIFGAPGETNDGWRKDLARAIALRPDHISTYGLTIERGTMFWNRLHHQELRPLNDESECNMFDAAIDDLTAAGLEHYEVSNFARPGQRCRHNETYWLGQPYLAAGPGASRYIDGRRETNHRSTTTYLKRVLSGQSPVAESEQLNPEDSARERLVFGLRRMQGVDRDRFRETTGFSIEQLGGADLNKFVDHKLLQWNGPQLQLTRAGLMVSDSLWPAFLRR